MLWGTLANEVDDGRIETDKYGLDEPVNEPLSVPPKSVEINRDAKYPRKELL